MGETWRAESVSRAALLPADLPMSVVGSRPGGGLWLQLSADRNRFARPG